MMTERSLFIATPAQDGKLHIPYAYSMSETLFALRMHGVAVSTHIAPGGSALTATRNQIIEAFWNSKDQETHLLCIDADLGWPAQGVLAMLDADRDFIAGVYPARLPAENSPLPADSEEYMWRPALRPDMKLIQDGNLLKADYVPAGFIMLSRAHIGRMRNQLRHLKCTPKNPNVINPFRGYGFFHDGVFEGEWWGEDFTFCRYAREAGAEIWVDPMIQFSHAGKVGMLAQKIGRMVEDQKTAGIGHGPDLSTRGGPNKPISLLGHRNAA